MDWNKGFSSAYYGQFIDPLTWRETERFELTGGSVKRTADGLRESADIDCIEFTHEERWIRLYLDTRQGDDSAHVPLMTGLTSTPEDDINGYLTSNSVQIYSVLKPVEDVLLPRGWYAPAGNSGAGVIRNLLSVTPAPVSISGTSPNLSASIIAEGGESNLSMAEKILEAIDWRMRIEGNGTIILEPKPTRESARFDALENDVIEPQLKKKRDWFSCPNIFRAVIDSVSAVARDDSPDSPLSTVSRGREIWEEDDNCELNEGETIAEHARRRLKEAQAVAESVSYDRRFRPGLYVGDLVRMSYPKQGIEGLYRIESQDIEMTHGASTAEEVVKV